jgi:chaperonin cofactor prefoldin
VRIAEIDSELMRLDERIRRLEATARDRESACDSLRQAIRDNGG